MWRTLFTRKLALLLVVAATAAAASYYRAGPPPADGYRAVSPGDGLSEAVRENVARWLRSAHGFPVAAAHLHLTAAGEAPLGYGQPVVAWFAAPPPGEALDDVWSVRLRLSAAGIPVTTAPPINVTQTPAGDERVLDALGHRILYATRVDGSVQGVVVLDFGPAASGESSAATRALAAVSARQSFGTWRSPARVDVVPPRALATLEGTLTPGGLRLTGADGFAAEVDLAADEVTPPGAARLLRGSAPHQEPLALLADVLRSSDIVGPARVMSVEGALFRLTDWLRRQHHRLFPTAADRLPVTTAFDPPPASAAWPPEDLALSDRLEDEGRWSRPAMHATEADPPVRHTFLRVDPERPYVRVHLFAFDTGRLGLHFVAGTRHPRSATGARGRGRVPEADRPRLVAAFNGGFKAEHGAFGAIEEGRVLVPPRPGLATVTVDPEGRAGFGIWDAPHLPPPWTGLRQNLAPLIADGVVNPARVRHWGEVVEKLDDAQTPRSALGVTRAGLLIYGWSEATSAELLGEALRRAGVELALHLDMNPGHTGVELYRAAGGDLEAAAGVPEMDFRPRRWLGEDARDFFYLARPDARVATLPLEGAAPGEGRWAPVPAGGEEPVLATTWLTAARVGGRRQPRLVLLDAAAVRLHVVPGLAEPRPATGLPLAELTLPAPPVAWLNVGLRRRGAPYGLVAAGETWRPPFRGEMTLAVDDAGVAAVGRWGAAALSRDRAWREVIQGPALVDEGQVVELAGEGTRLPIAAVGQAGERLIYGVADDGDRGALARALVIAGVTSAVLLSEQPTAETGVARFLHVQGGRLYARTAPDDPPQPTDLTPGAGTALAVTHRPRPPRARLVDTWAAEPSAASDRE